MLIAHSPNKLHTELDAMRFRGGTRRCVSLITTRGDLHDGHGAVINAAKTVSDVVVVGIMPGQSHQKDNVISNDEFKDIGFIERHKADVLYAPPEESLGSSDHIELNFDSTPAEFTLPQTLLTHYLKFLHAIQPDIMVWGERNFVEYSQVRRMIRELGIRTQVQCIPTVRHANGVAVSGDDDYFDEAQQEQLPIIFETLRNAAHAIRAGARNFSKVANTAKLAIKGAGFELDYFHILDEELLIPASNETTTYRIITRAQLGERTIFDSIGLTL